MSLDIDNLSVELRIITDDYFYQQITREEYIEKRKSIFTEIDREQCESTTVLSEKDVNSTNANKITEKVSSFFKNW